MQSISMVRFFTREQVRELYNLPPSVEAIVFASLQSFRDALGKEVYAEPDVDDRVMKTIGRRPVDTTPLPRPGRKPTTEEDAIRAQQLRKSKLSWKAIATQINTEGGALRRHNQSSIRAAVYRLRKHKSDK